jgi:hypothetical protein
MKRKTKKARKGKTSLVWRMKSQAAMEYLMTYGWSVLLILLMLGVVYSTGVINPKNFLPRLPSGSCFVSRPNGPGTTDFVSLQGSCGYLPMHVASFDGKTSYITLPNLIPNTAITVTVWIKSALPYYVGWDQVVCKYTAYKISAYSKYYVAFSIYTGTSGPYTGPDADGWYGTFSSVASPQNWHFIVGTFDSSLPYNQVKLYVDGKLVGVRNSAGTLYTADARQITVGRSASSWPVGSYFNGSIANIQIYNTALTPQEIQYLYQQGLGGAPVRLQNLVGWWPLNGDAKDYSGNNNHGTIYNVTFVQNYNPP